MWREFRAWLALILACACMAAAENDEGITWPVLGKLVTRHAREIRASNWSVGAETMDRDYTVYANWKSWLGPLGVKKARIQAGWAKTERQRGVYEWAWMDEIIRDMAEQGVEPWVCLCYGNTVYSEGGGTLLGAVLPAEGEALAAWRRWVAATVRRYGDVVDEWEVWNEPNLRRSNAASQYAAFLAATAETVRGVQPKARILAMSLAGVDTAFAEEVLRILAAGGKLSLVDEITYHPYAMNPDSSYAAVERLRQVVGKYSEAITLRQGENGAPSARRRTKALSNYNWTELSQAKWALRRLLGDLGRDIPSSYFSIIDMKYPDEMNMKGLLKARDDQTVEYAKPAYYAVQNVAAVFDNRLVRIFDYSYEAKTDASLSLFAYVHKPSGGQAVTVWLDGAMPSDDNTKTAIDFEFGNGCFEEPVWVDLRKGGVYRIPEENVDRDKSAYRFTEVPVYDSPVLIADERAIGWKAMP